LPIKLLFPEPKIQIFRFLGINPTKKYIICNNRYFIVVFMRIFSSETQ